MSDLSLDSYGFMMQIQPDGSLGGGDSVNWSGHRMYLDPKGCPTFYSYKSHYSWGSKGYAWKRHPYEPIWATYYKNPWNGNITRDQLSGILAAHIGSGNSGWRVILHHLAWLGLFSYSTVRNHVNPETSPWKFPDPTGPDIWAMEIRSLPIMGWLLWPLLWVLDLQMLLSTLFFNWWVKDIDVISFAIKAIVQREHKPTPISWLAWKLLDKGKLKNFVWAYWAGEKWRAGNKGMVALYNKRIDEL